MLIYLNVIRTAGMEDPRATAQALLDEWNCYRSARPREHVLDIQYDKDQLTKWATALQRTMLWSTSDNELAEACYQFEHRLNQFKDKIVIELLTGGAA